MLSPQAFHYHQLTVTGGFVHGAPFDKEKPTIIKYSEEGAGSKWPDNLHFLQQEIHTYERLEIQDCKKAYAQHFVKDRANVVVVVKPEAQEVNSSTVFGGAFGGWGAWPKRMPERCRLEYSYLASIITFAANTTKVMGFIATYWLLKRTSRSTSDPKDDRKTWPLITTGDAVASFLEFPDPETVGMSAVEVKDFRKGIWNLRWARIGPIKWMERSPCCSFRAVGLRRWLIGTVLLSIVPIAPAGFLLNQYQWLNNDLQLDSAAIKQVGIGQPSGLFLFGGWIDSHAADPLIQKKKKGKS
ncbi:hypothetical protein CC80DRAFT_499969 [Byssothecium circinans]|uniref:Uncharacterized protein n=1 Tax=Byssothecium circinans TaxID=147558 RepID=A0A6A5U8T4_9PLEO|nr:hypothetical protein CC80DRAFT_499969 [Byssothecium circinans]